MPESKTRAATGKQIACRKIDIVMRNTSCFPIAQPMKRHCAAILLTLASALPVSAQAPDTRDQQHLTDLVRELQSQQAQIIDNQTKIETKMAELAETIRVARIFAGRAGK
jgi:hypothetical protein